MPPTEKPGSSASTPTDQAASFGGPGWRQRTASHAEELRGGTIWAPYGVDSETGRLQAVLLSWPGPELEYAEPPDHWLMLAQPDLERIRQQAQAIVDFYRDWGAQVHLLRPSQPPPPNLLFMRDLVFMTPEGAVLGRTAGIRRAGEERFAALGLAQAGVPILRTPRGLACFEGADALWLRPDLVLLGVGVRSNEQAEALLGQVLAEQGVRLLTAALPAGVQHLLGVVNLLDQDLAAVHGGKVTPALLQLLEDLGIQALVLAPDVELLQGRGMNFVTLAPREVVMPSRCPGMRATLEGAGVRVHELDVSEYLKAAGGLGCLTGILSRAQT